MFPFDIHRRRSPVVAAVTSTQWRVRAPTIQGTDNIFAPADIMLLATPLSTAMIGPNTTTASVSPVDASAPLDAWDGSNTNWHAVTASTGNLSITFTATQAPTAIKLVARTHPSWRKQMPRQLIVEYYNGSTWVTAMDISNIPEWGISEQRIYSFSAASGSDFTWPWAQQTHARVRAANTLGGNQYFGMSELEMHNTVGGVDLTTGLTATASANAGAPYLPATTIDNNNSTFWSSGATAPANTHPGNWLAVNVTQKVDEIVFTSRSDTYRNEDPFNLFVDLSFDNGATWVEYWGVYNLAAWTAGQARTFAKPVPAYLDVQTITTGSIGASPNRFRGYSSSLPIGSITDGSSSIYDGAAVMEFYWDEQGAAIVLQIAGAANSGWTSVSIAGVTLNRVDATYSGGNTWTWPSAATAATNPFGTVGQVKSCIFT